MAAGKHVVLLAGPVAYVLRRMALRREYRFEFRLLKDLAQSDPRRIERQEQTSAIHVSDELESLSIEPEEQRDCFEILGLPPSASMEELRTAYKRLIKQYHPDRVHGLAPAFTSNFTTGVFPFNWAISSTVSPVAPAVR